LLPTPDSTKDFFRQSQWRLVELFLKRKRQSLYQQMSMAPLDTVSHLQGRVAEIDNLLSERFREDMTEFSLEVLKEAGEIDE
jgi:hypothetical protein